MSPWKNLRRMGGNKRTQLPNSQEKREAPSLFNPSNKQKDSNKNQTQKKELCPYRVTGVDLFHMFVLDYC